MLRLVGFKCGCVGTSTVSGMSHLLRSCEVHGGDEPHPRGTFLLKDMKGVKRQSLGDVETGMELMKLKPETKPASLTSVVDHLHEMEDNKNLFREACYALSQVNPALFSDVAAAVRGQHSGWEIAAKMLLSKGEWIKAIKLVRERTGMEHKEAKTLIDRMKESMKVSG